MATTLELKTLKKSFGEAKCPEDVFGTDPKANYRSLARLCHPDNAEMDLKNLATEVFQKLNEWKAQADQKLTEGTYGDNKPVKPPKPPYQETELTVGKSSLRLVAEKGEGLVSSIHEAVPSNGCPDTSYFLKISRKPQDNDLLEREFRHLTRIRAVSMNPKREGFFAIQRPYLPAPELSFLLGSVPKGRRRANLLSVASGEAYTLETLLNLPKFKNGLERKHMYWIFRRLLLTLWMAHQRGIVHGAITPDHVLVYPKEHGLVLLDWTASAEIGKEHVPIINKNWERFYPIRLLKKDKASPEMDIFMAIQVALWVIGAQDIPDAITNAMVVACDPNNPRRRPQDAMTFYNDFEKIIEEADGPRKFAELAV